MSSSDTCRISHILLHLLFFLASIFTVISDTDLQILLKFKSQLSNPSSLQSWRSDLEICNFTGIICDEKQSVSEIDLTDRNLSGQLPLDLICSLPSLKKLAVGSNSLSGLITPDLRNCSKLQHLNLAFNRFSGPLPDFSNLVDLRLLNLSMNEFSGPFPSYSIRNLSNLQSLLLGDNPTFEISQFPKEVLNLNELSWLYLSNCSLEGEIPPAIGKLTGLINLELSHNSLTGVIPPEIANLRNLFQLQLWDNNLTGRIPDGFRNLSGLQYFDASNNRLEGDIEEMKYLTNLISLQLFENQFEGGIPAELGNFKQLTSLALYSNKLSGPLPQALGSWAEFVFIDVSDNYLTGGIPPDMCKQGKMKKLLMLNNNFSGEIPATYASCHSMLRFRVPANLLSGSVPSGLWGLPNAEIIDLGFNGFDGPITSEIGNARTLGQLFISHNRFSGGLPPEISKATSLVTIDVSYNEFSGKIPPEIGRLNQLNRLLLQENRFSGEISDDLATCASLYEINFAGNSLSGQIPASLGSLQSLNSLNLSKNNLVGQIPTSLSSLKLSILDLSDNRLTGPIPDSLSVMASNNSFSGNPGLCSIQKISTLQLCSSDSGKSSKPKTLISCFLAGASVLVVALSCYFFIKIRRSDLDRPIKESWDMKSFQILTFTEEEILNSIKQENLIGKGGSGNVYRVILDNGKELAVKHIWNTDSGRSSRRNTAAMLVKRSEMLPEFEAEVSTLSSIRHVNVVKLYCSITSEDSSLLVYEYLPNGSLWDCLHTCEKMRLDWGTRHEIAVGAAKGLEYLHHGCARPIIHRDVKSSNILLDEFFKPRIADFGLAKIIQASGGKDSASVVAGTHGYIAPEYAYTCKVNEKSDVYSFGVVLMELVTGKRPIEPEFGENKDIVYWIATRTTSKESVLDLVDSRIPETLKEDAVKVLRIAVLCTSRLPTLRPTMRTVVQMLEDAEPCRNIAIGVKDEKKGGNFGFLNGPGLVHSKRMITARSQPNHGYPMDFEEGPFELPK